MSGWHGAAATFFKATLLPLTGVHVWVKSLVGSFCGPNMGLAFSLSSCLSVSMSGFLRHLSIAVEDGTHTLDIR